MIKNDEKTVVLTNEQKKIKLFNKQKETLDLFLARNAISQKQYDETLRTLREK